jgi:protein-S-isoprenylcysteine O-methyltransferase Ste14
MRGSMVEDLRSDVVFAVQHRVMARPWFKRAWTRIALYTVYGFSWLFVMWATPTMTIAHLFFAVVTSLYILVAIQFQENDRDCNYHG